MIEMLGQHSYFGLWEQSCFCFFSDSPIMRRKKQTLHWLDIDLGTSHDSWLPFASNEKPRRSLRMDIRRCGWPLGLRSALLYLWVNSTNTQRSKSWEPTSLFSSCPTNMWMSFALYQSTKSALFLRTSQSVFHTLIPPERRKNKR